MAETRFRVAERETRRRNVKRETHFRLSQCFAFVDLFALQHTLILSSPEAPSLVTLEMHIRPSVTQINGTPL